MFVYIQIKLMTLRLLAQQKMLSDVKPLIKMLSLVLQNSRGVIVRQPSSYTLHRLLKFFSMDSTPSWDLYCISTGYQEDILERSEKIAQNSKWPPFGEGQTLNWHHFRQNGSSFLILVSTIGFSGMPDLVVWSEITLDIALWENPRWPPFVQGQTINWYHFQQNRGIFILLKSIIRF